MGTHGFKVKIENELFILVYSRCRQNLKIGDFTVLFCGVRQRNAGTSVLHRTNVQHEYFCFFLLFMLFDVGFAIAIREFKIYDVTAKKTSQTLHI